MRLAEAGFLRLGQHGVPGYLRILILCDLGYGISLQFNGLQPKDNQYFVAHRSRNRPEKY